jgi:hypothetical protein
VIRETNDTLAVMTTEESISYLYKIGSGMISSPQDPVREAFSPDDLLTPSGHEFEEQETGLDCLEAGPQHPTTYGNVDVDT